MVYSPAAPGSPCTTLAWAPDGRKGGAGPHFVSDVEWMAWAWIGVAARRSGRKSHDVRIRGLLSCTTLLYANGAERPQEAGHGATPCCSRTGTSDGHRR